MCESRTEWTTPPATEHRSESSRGLSNTAYGPSDGEVSKSRFHSHDKCNELHYYLERGWRKCPSNPPKAIVTPLIGGVSHTKSHAVDTSTEPSHINSSRVQVCNTCQSHSKKLHVAGIKPTCDDERESDLQTTNTSEEWKTLIKTKDNILAQKNDLIERQKLSIDNLQQQLKDAITAETNWKTRPFVSARLKELEYENLSLKTQLKTIMQEKNAEIQQLGRNLNAVEYEFHKTSLERSRNDMANEFKKKGKELQTDNKVQLEELRERYQSLNQKLVALQLENVTLARECQKLQKLLFEGEAHRRHELQAMRERHKQRFVEATTELRLRHKAMAKRVRALEMQLLRNSDIVSALNSELQVSHGTIGDLKLSTKELVLQNQHLVEENVSLQESTTKVQDMKTCSDATNLQTKQLTTELAYCIEDLRSLISLCFSLLEGCDPSASLILGVEDHQSAIKVTANYHELDLECSVTDRLTQVMHLKARVDKLRDVVSEQFATRASNACHVQ